MKKQSLCRCANVFHVVNCFIFMFKMLKMNKFKLLNDGGSSWSVLWVAIKRCKSSMRGELPRTMAKLEPAVNQDLEESKLKPKKHPGRYARSVNILPERFLDAAKQVLQGHPKDLIKEQGEAFSQYLFRRKPPLERDEMMEKTSQVRQKILSKNPQLSEIPTNEEDLKMQEMKLNQKVLRKLKETSYNWKPITYDSKNVLMYLMMRAAPEYSALSTIFREIKLRDSEFQPSAILDFGSGVGTVFWASYEQWSKSMKEYFAVDTAGEMNNIAQLLVQDGSETKPPILQGTFFRQFLPASHILSYDLVVSAYSLMELPSKQLRLQTLENLWTKTNEFLVIVEQGSNAGYRLVMEARDFILQASANDVHVFAPCSHDFACPKVPIGVPCNFETGYYTLDSKQGRKLTERYCYVVLRKGRRRLDSEAWPRIASPVLLRGKHVVCRMCCNDGQLKEAVLTAYKHGKQMYKCARSSRWGDLLPVSLSEPIGKENGNVKENEWEDDRAIMEAHPNHEENQNDNITLTDGEPSGINEEK